MLAESQTLLARREQAGPGVAKALGIVDLWRDIAAIALIALVFLAISLALLRKQEA